MIFDALFGNQNIEKILLFLLVNEKCYAAQLAHSLGGAITPLQQALLRLEKGKILTSSLEGKTRLFRFNPLYPYLRELQALLKQGYHQLPLHEQQNYYCPERSIQKSYQEKSCKIRQALPLLWDHLIQVNELSFSAQSKAIKPSGWNGVGRAKVEVKSISPNCLLFHEKGVWTAKEGKQYDFKNIFRWTRDDAKSLITLEHLRHGLDHPVLLFELSPVSHSRFETLRPYLCRQDTTLAHLSFNQKMIQLNWRILGPNKNEDIHYVYT